MKGYRGMSRWGKHTASLKPNQTPEKKKLQGFNMRSFGITTKTSRCLLNITLVGMCVECVNVFSLFKGQTNSKLNQQGALCIRFANEGTKSHLT